MKIYDISQEVFSSKVYPGDRSPQKIVDKSISIGDAYNLTSLSMCTHNGTHVDAPSHFIDGAHGVDGIPLEYTVGYCYLASHSGELTAAHAMDILNRAGMGNQDATKRILIKGEGIVTLEAAELLSTAGIYLLGVESQTVGPEDAPMPTHLALLQHEVCLLEGLHLDNVPDGEYFLCAQPINLAGSDGAPCRAILITK